MVTRRRGEGAFTLIEVLVGLTIFAIGSLGVLSMMLASTTINANARQSQESQLIANWLLEQMAVRPEMDAQITGCGTGCWATYGDLKKTSASTLAIPEIQSGAVFPGATVRYQARWMSDVPASGLRHYQVVVAWPKDSALQTLQGPGDPSPDGSFLDCFASGNQGRCLRAEFHTYRRVN